MKRIEYVFLISLSRSPATTPSPVLLVKKFNVLEHSPHVSLSRARSLPRCPPPPLPL
jgi:hypothetical protein